MVGAAPAGGQLSSVFGGGRVPRTSAKHDGRARVLFAVTGTPGLFDDAGIECDVVELEDKYQIIANVPVCTALCNWWERPGLICL